MKFYKKQNFDPVCYAIKWKFSIFAKKIVIMFLESYSDAIFQLCQQNKVKSLYAFGSVLTSGFSKKSDIDFIVDIDSAEPYEYADNYFNLKFALQDILKRNIDLLEEKSIRNQYIRANIEQSKKLIYAK